jgi:hypothetical protein
VVVLVVVPLVVELPVLVHQIRDSLVAVVLVAVEVLVESVALERQFPEGSGLIVLLLALRWVERVVVGLTPGVLLTAEVDQALPARLILAVEAVLGTALGLPVQGARV